MNAPGQPKFNLELKDFYRRQLESTRKDCAARGNRCEVCLHKYCLQIELKAEAKGEGS